MILAPQPWVSCRSSSIVTADIQIIHAASHTMIFLRFFWNVRCSCRNTYGQHVCGSTRWIQPRQSRPSTKLIAFGFGYRSVFDDKLSPKLMVVQLEELPKEYWNDFSYKNTTNRDIRSDQLCVGSNAPGKDIVGAND